MSVVSRLFFRSMTQRVNYFIKFLFDGFSLFTYSSFVRVVARVKSLNEKRS